MKKNLILTGAAILALLFTSCNKEETESISTSNGNKAITLSISGANLTKSAVDNGAAAWDATAAYSNLDIYFCDAADKILYAYSIADDTEGLITALTNGTGVRFINLENVTAVYVAANASTALSAGTKVSTLTEYLYNQAPFTTAGVETEKNAITYIGGDTSLDFGQEPDDAATTIDYASGAWTEVTSYEDNQYYKADLSIRPIISRLEMNSIQALASGTYTDTYTDNSAGVTYTYSVNWTGFEPELKGIYMSNFYGSITPVVPSMGDFFQVPTGDKVDTAGEGGNAATYLWNSAAGIGTAYNVDGITLYTSGSADANLFDGVSDGNGNYVYYNGNSSTCVPFNFFVPFDVTETADVIDRNTTVMPSTPRYHFLVNLDAIYEANSYSYSLYVTSSDGAYDNTLFTPGSLTDEEEVLYQLFTADFNFTAVDDGNYYANIVNLYESSSATTEAIIQPNTIYKTDVTIAPYNLTTSTIYEDSHNVIVIVHVVPYAIKNVTVAFDKN